MSDSPDQRPFKQKVATYLKQSFASGLLFLVPVVLTIWMFTVLVGWVDSAILVLPRMVGLGGVWIFHIPGIGVIFAVLLVLFCGVLVKNYLGSFLIVTWDKAMHGIPFVGSVYSSIKQLVQTMFGGASKRFGRVVLVEFPRKGLWSIGFVTNERASHEIQAHFEEPFIQVFVMMAPNPTSGFVLLVAKSEVIELNMKVDDAFKLIVSCGIVRSEE